MPRRLWIALFVLTALLQSARALDHGFNPNDPTVRWFESLMMPDHPPSSCCGKADAYPVEDYFPNPDGTITAIIGDGSAKVYPDGRSRPYIAGGTRVIVPREKINPRADDLDNPTDVSWIFMSVYAGEVGSVFCFIPHPNGN